MRARGPFPRANTPKAKTRDDYLGTEILILDRRDSQARAEAFVQSVYQLGEHGLEERARQDSSVQVRCVARPVLLKAAREARELLSE